ncbi:helix-turn-helix transcriptional regulator [Flavitalea sp. BT771]|uniref:helix-turn-helix domain-containing protein n=1 Tax=Flavitalea sp. BT771 TaxID=3063329 RepID=UPI0026E1AD53|nr:helix-turn-helix domain-containing protein [Flavitalea sp. BT771]MDO6431159.1 helix-turn-helix transcriptional regulator [Flavitalea sp. BT771]MDV6220066.1 helix-turn-helix transcriptional regulator [Flavitalea sp. BT771]
MREKYQYVTMPTRTLPTDLKFIEKQIPFQICSLAWYFEKGGGNRQLPHKHEHFEVIWMQQGSGTVTVDLENHSLSDNTLFCIFPGQLHSVEYDITACGSVISIPETITQNCRDHVDLLCKSTVFNFLKKIPKIKLSKICAAEVDHVVSCLHEELNAGSPLAKEIIQSYTSILMIYLARQLGNAPVFRIPDRKCQLAQHFMQLVDKKFISCKMVRDYALELGVTPNYLNQAVRETTGFSAGHLVRRRIALEAKRQAVFSQSTMKEIAYYLGFEDMAHFSKFFKTVEGQNFTQFRKAGVKQVQEQ